MQEKISQQMRQIRIIDEGVKSQLKKMLNEQGYGLDVIYDESTSYVIVDADGYEYEIRTFNENLDGYPIKEIINPWTVDLMKFHSEWHDKYNKALKYSAELIE
jgi:hypothetical protein